MADEGCSLKQIYNACEEASKSMGELWETKTKNGWVNKKHQTVCMFVRSLK